MSLNDQLASGALALFTGLPYTLRSLRCTPLRYRVQLNPVPGSLLRSLVSLPPTSTFILSLRLASQALLRCRTRRSAVVAVTSRRSLPHGSRRGSQNSDLFGKMHSQSLIGPVVASQPPRAHLIRALFSALRPPNFTLGGHLTSLDIHRSLFVDGTAAFVPHLPTHRSANASWALGLSLPWG